MLANEDILSFLAAFVPAAINIAILFYILRFMPRGKLITIFSFLLLSLIAMQIEHSLVRLNVSESFARYVNQVTSGGWLALGCLLVHFATVFTESKLMHSRLFYISIYAPYALFYTLYHANPEPVPHIPHEVWGYIVDFRPGTLDKIQRFWMVVLVCFGMGMLLSFSFSKKTGIIKRKQALIMSIGILIPTIQGFITQVIYPFVGKAEIPITSTFITSLSVAIIIALTRYKLFNISESLEVKEVLDKLTIPVFCISSDKKLIYFNSAFQEVFGICNKKHNIGISKIFLNEGEYNKFWEQLLKNSGNSLKNFKSTMVTYNEEPVHMLLSSHHIYNNKKLQGVLFFASDITDRIKSEEELRVSNQRYKIVTKATAEVIYDLDIEKEVIYWGEGYKKLFKYDIKGNITDLNHWEQRIHSDDCERVMTSFVTYLRNNKVSKWEVEYRYLKSDGSYANILDRGFILRNSAGIAVRMVGAMQDVTFIKSYIRKIENQNSSLREIAWLQSHVVRAPLAKIMGINNLLMDNSTNDSETKMLLKALDDSCEELDEVIRKIHIKTEDIHEDSKNSKYH